MSRKLNTLLGYYTPAFFKIYVGTNISLERFSEEDFSVFIHEYIHFLQDTTTIYGLYNMYVQSEYIRFATHMVYGSGREFQVPIIPNTENDGNIYLNKMICTLSQGDGHDINVVKTIETIDIMTESTGVHNTPVDEMESVCVTLTDDFDRQHVLVFGALSIMENMAYLIEQMVCPNYKHSPDYPYSFAEKIVEEIYPEFGVDKLNVLALCDMSLMYNSPGKVFVQFLNEFKTIGWLPELPENIYDKILNRAVNLNGNAEMTLEENYKELSNVVKEQVKNYFNDDTIFHDIRIWVDQLIDSSINLRFRHKYFLLDLARSGEVKDNKAFDFIKDQHGTPLITNLNGECTLYCKNKPDGIDLGYFWAIGQIISLFDSGEIECSLKTICTKYGNDVDDRCNNEPWTRCEDRLLCPYAMLWRHWNLRSYVPKK